LQYKVLLFDFDGTIANSADVVLQSLAALINKYNYPNVTPKQLKHKQAKSIFEKIRMLLFMAKIKKEFKALYGRHSREIPLFEGMADALSAIAEKDYSIAILSSNDPGNIRSCLDAHHISINADIIPSSGLFGKHKTIRAYLSEKGYRPEEALYIGDEIRDIVACNKTGVDIVFVRWGADSDEHIGSYKVHCEVSAPAQLVNLL